MARLMTYKQYLESDTWKCGESPTGAHHWIARGGHSEGIFVCKYCMDVRKLPTAFSQAMISKDVGMPELSVGDIETIKEENNVET